MQLRVVGAHLPRLDQSGVSSFIVSSVERFRRTLRDLRAKSDSFSWSDEEIEDRALELPRELDADLQRCALFEIEVIGNNSKFDPSAIHEVSTTNCGWEPAFLSMDGERIITESYTAPAELNDFRVAFYIHEWPENGRLIGPLGEVPLPAFTPVPNRLWTLAPYNCVD
jgi:hypothetical protein